jgi:hypothetical protein
MINFSSFFRKKGNICTTKCLVHLKRVTKIKLDLRSENITPNGASNIITENLQNLEDLSIRMSDFVDTSVLQIFAQKFKKLKALEFDKCKYVRDEGVLAISKMDQSITSLSLVRCENIFTSGLSHLASMPNLRALIVWFAVLNDQNLEQISSSLLQLELLDLKGCRISNLGTKYVKSLSNLSIKSEFEFQQPYFGRRIGTHL